MTEPATDLEQASEIVQELIRNSLTLTEICRLTGLLGRTSTMRGLQEGTVKAVKPEVVQALRDGYDRFLTGDVSYRVRRSTRPEEPVRPAADAKPQPRLQIQGSRLWQRVAEKRKEAA